MCVSVLYGMTRTKNQTLSFRRHREKELRQIWNRYGRGEKNPDYHASQAKFFYNGTHTHKERKTIQSRDWFTHLSIVFKVCVCFENFERDVGYLACLALNCVCCRSHLEMIMDEMRELLYFLFSTHNRMNPTLDFSNRTLEKVRGTNEVLMGLLLFVEYFIPSCPLMMSVSLSTFLYISLSLNFLFTLLL